MIRGYKISFSVKTSHKSASKDLKLARLFLLLSLQNFKDNNILTYFGGSHLRSDAAAAEWLNAPVLKPNTSGFYYLLGHRFYQTKIILNLAY